MLVQKVRVICPCRCRRLPDRRCLLRAPGISPGFFRFALAPHRLYTRPVCCLFGRREIAPDFGAPGLADSAAPIAEATSRNAIIVQRIPSGIVAALAVAGEPPQLAVRLYHLRRNQASGS